MDFYSVRDLRVQPKTVWSTLSADGEVIITNNGKPMALMMDLTSNDFEQSIKAVRQAKATLAVNAMRDKAAKHGFMSEAEIDVEIQAYRAAKNKI